MGFTLNCKLAAAEGDDRIDVSRGYDGDIRFSLHGDSVFTNDAEARDFARQLLALVGDEAEVETTESIKVGDRVEITKYQDYDRAHVGKVGTVDQIDTDDTPFRVRVDGHGPVWAMEVRVVTASASSRSAAFDEARRIAGPDASAADVLAYAKFLSE